jgi:hypothetical protein
MCMHLSRIIHEDFYYNRRYAAVTSLTAGGLAAQSINILMEAGALLFGGLYLAPKAPPQTAEPAP